MIVDIEELEKLDASEIQTRRINQCERSIDITRGRRIHIPSIRWYSKIARERLRILEPTPRRERTARSEDLFGELQGEPGEPQPTESKDDAEARADFWSIQGDFIYRHHESRVSHDVPKEVTLLIPLKSIDVTRSTHTDLDVMQETTY